MKEIGVLVLLNTLIVTSYLGYTGRADITKSAFICTVGVIIGFGLMLSDRLTGVKVPLLGELTAAAKADAEVIEDLRKQIETDSEAIKMIVRDANAAKDQIKEIEKSSVAAHKRADEVGQITADLEAKNAQAAEKLTSIDLSLQKANEALNKLDAISGLNTLIISAQNDNRKAYDQLMNIAKTNPPTFLSSIAVQAVGAIMDKYDGMFILDPVPVPWKENVKPEQLTLQDFVIHFPNENSDVRRSILKYIWERKDFTKYERMQFLVDTMKNDPSLKVVDYAGRLFQGASNDKLKSVYVDGHLGWWSKNKDAIAAEDEKEAAKNKVNQADVATDLDKIPIGPRQ